MKVRRALLALAATVVVEAMLFGRIYWTSKWITIGAVVDPFSKRNRHIDYGMTIYFDGSIWVTRKCKAINPDVTVHHNWKVW